MLLLLSMLFMGHLIACIRVHVDLIEHLRDGVVEGFGFWWGYCGVGGLVWGGFGWSWVLLDSGCGVGSWRSVGTCWLVFGFFLCLICAWFLWFGRICCLIGLYCRIFISHFSGINLCQLLSWLVWWYQLDLDLHIIHCMRRFICLLVLFFCLIRACILAHILSCIGMRISCMFRLCCLVLGTIRFCRAVSWLTSPPPIIPLWLPCLIAFSRVVATHLWKCVVLVLQLLRSVVWSNFLSSWVGCLLVFRLSGVLLRI